ncbi:MAG: hypothetical protein IPL78_18955 [Chloroflexi bacterium]|nr:hypothetical protein [Chloroflexota bacterium]
MSKSPGILRRGLLSPVLKVRLCLRLTSDAPRTRTTFIPLAHPGSLAGRLSHSETGERAAAALPSPIATIVLPSLTPHHRPPSLPFPR